jgi:photosystem II stability/assembly factor-like uncharacterized protein
MFIESRGARKGTALGVLVGLCGASALLGCGNSDAAPPPAPAPQGWTMTTELTGVDLKTVWGDGSDVFVAGSGAKVAHSGDGGMTWASVDTSAVAIASAPVYRHISGTRAGDVWIAGSAGDDSVLLHSADYGASWQRRDIGNVTGLSAVWAVDETHILIGTSHGDVLRSQDGGATFAVVSHQTGATIDALWGATTGYVYAVGGQTPGAASQDAAANASPGCDGSTAIDQMPASDAGTDLDGLLLRSADGGATWTAVGVAPAGELWNVWGISVGSLIVASGAHESVVTSLDGGDTWGVDARRLSTFDLDDVWVDPTGATYFAASNGVVVDLEYSCLGPVGVRTESLPAGPSGETGTVALWGSTASDLWAVGPGGIIRHRH